MPLFEWEHQPSLGKTPDGKQVSVPPAVLGVKFGATFPVRICVPPQIQNALRQAQKPIPPPKDGMALIDTGAEVSGIDEQVCFELGVPQVGNAKLGHIGKGGPEERACYPVMIQFYQNVLPPAVVPNMVSVDLVAPTIVLLGRDFLHGKKFIYNGNVGRYELCT